jgi:SAM-dependent methyltransferase
MIAIRNLIKRGEDRVVRQFLQSHSLSPKRFVSRIDKRDEMFLFDLQINKGDRTRTAIGYFTIGSRIFNSIRQLANWQFGGLQNVGAFLDFACGYGRSTRFLIQELPPERVWACDIYAEAIRFQNRYYGVNGVVSVPDPADFPKGRKFDFIFASSFFSHMPESSFGRWIETLRNLLTERGILVFSTHDVSLLPASVDVPPSGIYFIPNSESRTLDKNQYGSSYVSESFVTRIVDQVTGGEARVHRIKRGLVWFQDLYIVTRESNRDFTDLNFLHDPSGNFDSCRPEPAGHGTLTGWAADLNPGGSIKEIQFISSERVIQAVTPSFDRPDVAVCFNSPSILRSGWTCQLREDCVRPTDIIEIKVVNQKAQSRTIAYDTFKALLNRRSAAA